MSAQSISPAFTTFQDIDGQPLEGGMIYIGTAGLAAATNQITVYWDAALTQVATQPIRTVGGYPMNSGAPGVIYTGADDYSIAVNDKNNSPIYPALNKTQFLSATSVNYTTPLTGAVSRTLSDKLSEQVSIKDFGAVGDGVTNDTAAFAAAEASATSRIFIPRGVYLIDSLTISTRNKNYIGEGTGSVTLGDGVQLKCANTITDFVTVEDAVYVRMENIGFDGNNKATNTVRYSNNLTDIEMNNCIISGCVNSGVNLNLEPKTADTQVSELIFYKCLFGGRPGGSGITNMRCDSAQFLVNSFYDCKWFGNIDGDVSKNIDIANGQINCYSPFFTGLTTGNDVYVSEGSLSMYEGRSESDAIDSIHIFSGGGRIFLSNYVHGATISQTTYIQSAGFTGKAVLNGGTYTNISLTGTTAEVKLDSTALYSGGTLTGTGATNALIIGSLGRSGREAFELSQATLTNLKGISASDANAVNLTGTGTVTGGSANFSVTFATEEPDTLYHIFVTPESETGSPVADSHIVTSFSKATTGFTCFLAADPTSTHTVTFSWLLIRYG